MSVNAIENIKIGTNKGNVKTLVIDNLLLFEIVIEAVIEDIKTMLNKDSANNKLIDKKYENGIFNINKIRGEKIKNITVKLM
ncbi:hypothetical protein N9X75_01585 [Alphaproteobacteria bacterium]|nr:hypothetical protein [Alphaproteobacteria bacterium]